MQGQRRGDGARVPVLAAAGPGAGPGGTPRAGGWRPQRAPHQRAHPRGAAPAGGGGAAARGRARRQVAPAKPLYNAVSRRSAAAPRCRMATHAYKRTPTPPRARNAMKWGGNAPHTRDLVRTPLHTSESCFAA